MFRTIYKFKFKNALETARTVIKNKETIRHLEARPGGNSHMSPLNYKIMIPKKGSL